MRRNLSLIEQFERDRDSERKQKDDPWSILVIVLCGLLACAWITFWAAS